MLERIEHRGPDGSGLWTSDHGHNLTIGHVRLSIIDVAGGKQPIPNEDKTAWIIVNGEIYNYQRLREMLEENHEFATGSDSEVILHLYEEYGPAAIPMLDGMFALAIWDHQHGLLLARDYIGIKPLYYQFDENTENLVFASEMKALVDLQEKKDIEQDRLSFDTLDPTVLNEIKNKVDIKEFPNGHYWRVGRGSKPQRYYRVPRPKPEIYNRDAAVQLIHGKLIEAVQKRLMSDVPLGTFLSGGLDSSLITAMVKKLRGDAPLHTFSVGLKGSPDILAAREVAAHVGTIHHEKLISKDEILEALPIVIHHLESYDPALVRSAIPTYFVSELARKHVTVVLSGEGADELFGAYHYLAGMEADDALLNKELWNITRNLHNSNLQRVDRMTMANKLEGRVPFLDADLIEVAFLLDPEIKRSTSHSKWILRKIAEEYLPKEFAWRVKEKFSIGTGIGPLLEEHAETTITDVELSRAKRQLGSNEAKIKSKEELIYYNLFKEHYNNESIIDQMGKSRSLNPGEMWS
jgi:asparagine synthase (glutamine-hydrolysing)